MTTNRDSGSMIRGNHSGAFILERWLTDGETATKFFGLANRNIIDSTRNWDQDQIIKPRLDDKNN